MFETDLVVVGYLGPSGSYSESACHLLYPVEKYPAWEFHQFTNLTELINAIEHNKISIAIMPVENSKNGLLKDPQGQEFFTRIAMMKTRVSIIGEKFLPLNFRKALV